MIKSATKYKITANGIAYTSDGESLKDSIDMALQFSGSDMPDHVRVFFTNTSYLFLHVYGLERSEINSCGHKMIIEKV